MSQKQTGVSQPPIFWYREKPVWIMLFLGFSAGVPLYLVFGSLSLWLREAGVDRSTVTYFSWAVLGYSFKFVWAPLVDRLPLPLLTKHLGRRRGWLLCSQLSIVLSILLMASSDPSKGLFFIALGAVLLGFSSATQDIVIDAYKIESAVPRLQALLSSTYVAGYRVGMMMAGAWALILAESFGSTKELYVYVAWQKTYLIMALVMLVGIVTTLVIREPAVNQDQDQDKMSFYKTVDYLSFVGVFCCAVLALVVTYTLIPNTPKLFESTLQGVFGFVYGSAHFLTAILVAFFVAKACASVGWVNPNMIDQGYIAPFRDFFERYGKLALWVLLLVGFYRISDIVLGVVTNIFYQDMGYTKIQIASITKMFGVVVTILGAMLGGVIAVRVGVMRSLFVGAILVALTNLLFVWLTHVGENHREFTFGLPFISDARYVFPQELFIVILIDNLAQGFAIAAFLGWLSSLTNVSFSATQYAIFSSAMTLLPKVLGGYSGALVESMGYSNFFIFASLIGLPVAFLIVFLSKRLQLP